MPLTYHTRIMKFFIAISVICSSVLLLNGCASLTDNPLTSLNLTSDQNSLSSPPNDELPKAGMENDPEETASLEESAEDDATLLPTQRLVDDLLSGQDENEADEAPPLLPQEQPDTGQTANLLDRIRANFKLNLDLENKEVAQQVRWYSRHQRYLNRVFARSSRYLHYIANEVERRNLPMELALLPVVESAFDPFAYSHGRASGLWQFIPGTATRFGMKINWWYDGRRDVIASTEGALAYLSFLNQTFDGDWLHALASYNAGEGTVMRAIRKNRKRGRRTDFWHLDLPRETSGYVPKLIAIAKIVREPEAYGVTLPFIADSPVFTRVDTGGQLDLAQAAEMAGITLDELYRLNPGFNRWATAPDGPDYLLLPIEHADTFKTALAELPEEKRITWERYKIRQGDSLIKIAKTFNTTVDVIKRVNHLKSHRIRAGKALLIPKASAPLDQYALSLPERNSRLKAKSKAGQHKIYYTVRKGDNFWDISRKFRVNYRSLAKWNGMAPADTLKPGTKLVIWKKGRAATGKVSSSRAIKRLRYNVREGDSLWRIASKFNVRVKDITGWNKISPRGYLQPGQTLTLFIDVTAVN